MLLIFVCIDFFLIQKFRQLSSVQLQIVQIAKTRGLAVVSHPSHPTLPFSQIPHIISIKYASPVTEPNLGPLAYMQ